MFKGPGRGSVACPVAQTAEEAEGGGLWSSSHSPYDPHSYNPQPTLPLPHLLLSINFPFCLVAADIPNTAISGLASDPALLENLQSDQRLRANSSRY